jgi:hypothetical protein
VTKPTTVDPISSFCYHLSSDLIISLAQDTNKKTAESLLLTCYEYYKRLFPLQIDRTEVYTYEQRKQFSEDLKSFSKLTKKVLGKDFQALVEGKSKSVIKTLSSGDSKKITDEFFNLFRLIHYVRTNGHPPRIISQPPCDGAGSSGTESQEEG